MNKCLKLFLSCRSDLFYSHIPPTISSRPQNDTSDCITLEHILKESPHPRSLPKRWKLNQRMTLAFKIASSLLQYHSTPWIQGAWSKQTIVFSRMQSPYPRTTTLFDVDHPFINHRFTQSTAEEHSQTVNAKRSLLDLGILLLEIYCERTLEDYAQNLRISLEDTYGSGYDAARKWVDDTCDDIPPLYWDAVDLCIECPFTRTSTLPDWNDREFLKAVCDGIVKPLWDNCSGRSR